MSYAPRPPDQPTTIAVYALLVLCCIAYWAYCCRFPAMQSVKLL